MGLLAKLGYFVVFTAVAIGLVRQYALMPLPVTPVNLEGKLALVTGTSKTVYAMCSNVGLCLRRLVQPT
jgi:nitrate reductase gamma subunit